ncbi:hypothetical protein [Variovorax atrisoli]|uniref:hypothetical protein n=1 Tax=Variovorax atrisoli TaxID=3394203 RepID=UPI00161CE8F9|nr:hypothetical protein [Variovorax sp. BK613]MBB3642254.1 hypothetical protein [Variovorax sp. BK613]
MERTELTQTLGDVQAAGLLRQQHVRGDDARRQRCDPYIDPCFASMAAAWVCRMRQVQQVWCSAAAGAAEIACFGVFSQAGRLAR